MTRKETNVATNIQPSTDVLFGVEWVLAPEKPEVVVSAPKSVVSVARPAAKKRDRWKAGLVALWLAFTAALPIAGMLIPTHIVVVLVATGILVTAGIAALFIPQRDEPETFWTLPWDDSEGAAACTQCVPSRHALTGRGE